ncbi:MAG: hypothetical protein M3O32_07175, partial [Actinomycetota bacterium]|nr:hypothetical protein [Actinomycetota bacterium]
MSIPDIHGDADRVTEIFDYRAGAFAQRELDFWLAVVGVSFASTYQVGGLPGCTQFCASDAVKCRPRYTAISGRTMASSSM